MAKAPTLPAYKKHQQDYRAAAKTKKILHTGGTVALGIKQFKRDHPDADHWTIQQFKDNAHKTFDPKKVEVKPKPTKFEVPKPRVINFPPGFTNKQRFELRRKIRQQVKGQQHAGLPGANL